MRNGRWLLALLLGWAGAPEAAVAQRGFEIVHLDGRRMSVADAVSAPSAPGHARANLAGSLHRTWSSGATAAGRREPC